MLGRITQNSHEAVVNFSIVKAREASWANALLLAYAGDNAARDQCIDVIDHTNVMDEEFAYREPQEGSGDWRMGSQVIVGPSQAAVFVYRGQAQDILREGAHTLSTMNLPLLSSIIGFATSGRTPFTADLYFVNLRGVE